MTRFSEKIVEVDESMKLEPSLVCCPPSVTNIKHVEPQLILECTEASFIGSEVAEAKPVAEEHASNPVFGKLKMQTLDACHKNFVIFDHCDGQNTVILHPSWLRGPPSQSCLEPGYTQQVNGFLDNLQAVNSRSIEAMFGLDSLAALSPAFRDATEAALQVRQKLSNVQKCSVHNLEKQVVGTFLQSDFDQAEFHENTEEINVLMSSDDELSSTGHSPSDAASNCHSGTMKVPDTNIFGKKRKLEYPAVDEADDADSGSSKLAPCHTPLNRELRFLGESGTFEERGLMNSPKRIKIQSNVQQLKNVIPGAERLDTAGVLGRTINYVKCLQNKLRGLEAARESARPMHQLG